MQQYKTTKLKGSKDLILQLTTANGTHLTLVNYYSALSQTYPGWYIHSPVESVRGFLSQYPDFLQVADVEPIKWAEANGFERLEFTENELLILNLS